ncbi:MAG TPA: hypothetical protein VGT41_01340 [Candidatus Babeliales bacterium]|nr:hypothetical protein [Candidatus Babeliales bacterium]
MNQRNFFRKPYLTLLTFTAMLSGCAGSSAKKQQVKKTIWMADSTPRKQHAPIQNDISAPQTNCQQMVTIWVHGTCKTYHFAPYGPIKKFFYTKPGIFDPRTLTTDMHHHTIGKKICQSAPEQFPADHFYMFGWSGILSFEAREEAAHQLYQEIITLLEQYEQTHGYRPRIRLITHSHGGNVALNLARIASQYSTPLRIDELVLLACPVQDLTAPYTQDPMFTTIYSLYSSTDLIQIADPQGLYAQQKNHTTSLFSRRKFSHHPKIRQVKIQINKRSLAHVEFILSQFVDMLPHLLDEIDTWSEEIWHNEEAQPTLSIMTNKNEKKGN